MFYCMFYFNCDRSLSRWTMSARSALSVSDADQPSVPPSQPSSEAVILPAAAPLDADKAAVDPAGKLETKDPGDTAETSGDVASTPESRSASVNVKPLRKTCILKLDGCHYTIGRNAPRTIFALNV